jgi:hypothetical protein
MREVELSAETIEYEDLGEGATSWSHGSSSPPVSPSPNYPPGLPGCAVDKRDTLEGPASMTNRYQGKVA